MSHLNWYKMQPGRHRKAKAISDEQCRRRRRRTDYDTERRTSSSDEAVQCMVSGLCVAKYYHFGLAGMNFQCGALSL